MMGGGGVDALLLPSVDAGDAWLAAAVVVADAGVAGGLDGSSA